MSNITIFVIKILQYLCVIKILEERSERLNKIQDKKYLMR